MKNCIVFAYHNIGIIGINSLIKNNFNISLVITYKKNLNENIWFKSVSNYCLKKNVKFEYFENLGFKKIIEICKLKKPDFLFSFYFRNIFPKNLLIIPKVGSINLHGSFLPKYRGASPVNWQIINGEINGGVTLHFMNSYIDGGNIINQKKIVISKKDTPVSLFKKIENKSRTLLNSELKLLKKNSIKHAPQNLKNSKIYKRRKPEDGRINWRKKIQDIYNLIRGVTDPYPGAFTYYNKNKITIWSSEIQKSNLINKKSKIGTFYKDKKQIKVVVKDGILVIKKLSKDQGTNLTKGKFK